MKLQYFGKVKEGKLRIAHRSEFDRELANFRDGAEVIVTVERKRSKRSIQQNAYYWGVVVPLVKQGMGDRGMTATTEETHELLKFKFRKKELVDMSTSEVHTFIGSTADMTKSEFMDFISSIQQWATQNLDMYIPDPNEQLTAFPE